MVLYEILIKSYTFNDGRILYDKIYSNDLGHTVGYVSRLINNGGFERDAITINRISDKLIMSECNKDEHSNFLTCLYSNRDNGDPVIISSKGLIELEQYLETSINDHLLDIITYMILELGSLSNILGDELFINTIESLGTIIVRTKDDLTPEALDQYVDMRLYYEHVTRGIM